jgi:putative thioredoxin
VVFDATEADFAERVIERSRDVPVVVDFWAEWCRPCRALTPALERAAKAREGKVDLAKVDTDANQGLALSFQVQSIPSVKAFKDGRVVDEFVGAVPPAEVDRFFDSVVPSEADELAEADDEASLRRALELDPRQAVAARRLGRLLLRRGDPPEDALALLEPFPNDFEAAGLAARARLAALDEALADAWSAWDEDRYSDALERLQEALAASDDADARDLLRKVMVAIFTELGPEHELSRTHRRRLAAAIT